MLDIALLKTPEGVELVRDTLKRRFEDDAVLDECIAFYNEAREARYSADRKNEAYKKKNKEVSLKKKAKEDADDLIKEAKAIDAECKELRAKAAVKDTQLMKKWGTIGNIVSKEVFVSKDEEENPVVVQYAPPTGPPAKNIPQDKLFHHHQLLEAIDGYEALRGAAVAGHRGYFLKGAGWMLNQALQSAGMAYMVSKGFTPMQPPYFMNRDVMAKTAQLSQFDEELYKVTGGENQESYLIATSEQPISALHQGEWMDGKDVPKKYAGWSTNFRKEAGSHGKDAWGTFRVHQFEKIEQFCITSPEKVEIDEVNEDGKKKEVFISDLMLEEMIQNAEGFLEALGIRYRRVQIVSGALNNAAAKKYDIEGWFPTLGIYRELMSVSNCTDYQSRNLEVRYKKKGAKSKDYVHMLNGTLCATERTMCCVLENYQSEKGIVIPEYLRPFASQWMGKEADIFEYKSQPQRTEGFHEKKKGKAAGKK